MITKTHTIELGFKEKVGSIGESIAARSRATIEALKVRHGIGMAAAKNGIKADAAREAVRNIPAAAGAAGRTGVRQGGRYVRGFFTKEAGNPATISDMIKEGMAGAGDWAKKNVNSGTVRNVGIGAGALIAGAGVYRAGGSGKRKVKSDEKFRNRVYRDFRNDTASIRKQHEKKLALTALSAREELDLITFSKASEMKAKAMEALEALKTKAGGLKKGAAEKFEKAKAGAKEWGKESERYIKDNPGKAVGIAGGTGFLTGVVARKPAKEKKLSSREELGTILFGEAGWSVRKKSEYRTAQGRLVGGSYGVEKDPGAMAALNRNEGKALNTTIGALGGNIVARLRKSGTKGQLASIGAGAALGLGAGVFEDNFRKKRSLMRQAVPMIRRDYMKDQGITERKF